MTSNKAAEKTTSRKGTNMEKKSKIQIQNKKKIKNSTSKNGSRNEDDEPEVKIVPSSSPGPQIEDEDEVDNDEVEEEEEEEDEAKRSDVTKQRSDKAREDMKEKKKKKKKEKSEHDRNNENVLYTFPMNRINRIIKSEDSDIRVTQEAVFLINKASEKFLELFCKEAYACSVLEHKSFVGYQHLSSVVGKRRRFDFLSDFVPEKVKAEDTLAEATPADT